MDSLKQHAQNIIDGKEPHEGEGIARMLEDEIERLGSQDRYISALLIEIDSDAKTWDIIDGSDEGGGWVDRAFLFKLIRATPEQRAAAFVEATKE